MLPSLYRLGLGWRVEVQLVGDLTKKKSTISRICVELIGLERMAATQNSPTRGSGWKC